MKSNKGFTLIELLAVIVILAIIALIATPIILGVIDTAKKGSAEASALAYVKAVEDQIIIGQVTAETTDDITLPTTGTKEYAIGSGELASVQVKGTAPTNAKGKVVIDSTGEVKTGTCLVVEMSGSTYNVAYDGSAAKVQEDACADYTGTTGEPSGDVSGEQG